MKPIHRPPAPEICRPRQNLYGQGDCKAYVLALLAAFPKAMIQRSIISLRWRGARMPMAGAI